jgi:hypothetical protein
MVAGGLEYALQSQDTYRADLTEGHGDFPATTIGHTSTSYQTDGFHLRIDAAGGFRPAGVKAPKSYEAAEVTANAEEVSSPQGAGFGPWWFYDESNGYGMALAADGIVTITSFLDGNRTDIATGTTARWEPGQLSLGL